MVPEEDFPDAGSGPAKAGSKIGLRSTEGFGGFAGPEAFNVDQCEGRPLELRQCAGEFPDRVARLGTIEGFRGPSVGDRDLGCEGLCSFRSASVGPLATEDVDFVGRDAIEPGRDGRIAPEGLESGDGSEENLLSYIFSVVRVAESLKGPPNDDGTGTLENDGKRLGVTGTSPGDYTRILSPERVCPCLFTLRFRSARDR